MASHQGSPDQARSQQHETMFANNEAVLKQKPATEGLDR
jgi:hypothetical protein